MRIKITENNPDGYDIVVLVAENEAENLLLKKWQHLKAYPQFRTDKKTLTIYIKTEDEEG